jgi:hypothetical protein
MTNAQYSDLVQAAGNIRATIMQKEMGDEGWDLRDEVLALQELVSQLATAVYQNHYVAHEPVRTVDPRQVRVPSSACCGATLRPEYKGLETTVYYCSQCGKTQK